MVNDLLPQFADALVLDPLPVVGPAPTKLVPHAAARLPIPVITARIAPAGRSRRPGPLIGLPRWTILGEARNARSSMLPAESPR